MLIELVKIYGANTRTLISKGLYYESYILIGLAVHCLIVIDQCYSERNFEFSNPKQWRKIRVFVFVSVK